MVKKGMGRTDKRGVIAAIQVNAPVTSSRRVRKVILVLAVSMALQVVSFGIIMPLFARRFGGFGVGVEALGLSAIAYSITSMTASPLMGSLADRYGRRPLVLGPLAFYVAAFTGYLLATSAGMFIAIRALTGALTAGLGPAVMGIVSDVAPENERARWIGTVGGGSSIGWIVGPALGGVLYDRWGYEAPFLVSIVMAAIALVVAVIMVPEPRSPKARQPEAHLPLASGDRRLVEFSASSRPISFWKTLPQPLSVFAALLSIGFIMIFAWAFVEPQLMFYVYDDLGWTSARLGASISGYGVALLLGQTMLGRSSDRFGRMPIIIVGLLLHSAQYMGVALSTSYQLVLIAKLRE
jgi:DHA1 family tetracycline resistance protein-like MFS transporter